MKIYLATKISDEAQGVILTKMKQKKRLLSYFYDRTKKYKLRTYINTGE